MSSYKTHGKNFVKESSKKVYDSNDVVNKYCKACSKSVLHTIDYVQIRSADEGMTVFTTCLVCGLYVKKNT